MSSSPLPFPATAVPQIQFTPEGPIIPTDADILAGVQEDINAAFGGGVNPQLSTPQGQLASSIAAITSDKDSEIALICNQIDPQYATGRFQDAIGRIYFLNRKGATSTVVTCTLTGLPTTVVTAGTLAQDTSGNTYVLLGNVTIGSGSTVSSSWANLSTGPIPCPSGTLIKVYQSVPGWDEITNPSDGVLGQNVESPSEFEFRRQNSVALNGHGTTEAIYAAVFNATGVLDCYAIDNPLSTTVDTGSTNYPVVAHSVYVAVIGGTDADVAQTIWSKKDTGCNYNGNTTVDVTDESGYNYPYPTYPVSFERPSSLPIFFAISIVNSPGLPSNIVALIQAAVVARFNGTDGTVRERIGSTIFGSRYYTAIAGVATGVIVLSAFVGDASSPSTTSFGVGIDQAPTLNIANVAVSLV